MSIYPISSLSKKSSTKKIKFVSAPCASGKTHAVIQHIRENFHRRNFIYCGRTIELVKETAKALSSHGVKTKVITSDDPSHEFRVKKDIAKFIEDAKGRGNVLLITANARIDLTHQVPSSWEIFFDEVPQTDSYHPWMFAHHQAFITDHLQLADDPTDGRMLVKIEQRFDSELEDIVRSVPDDIDKTMIPFYLETLSPGKEVFTDVESFQRVCERGEIATEHGQEKANKVHFISMLRPEPFLNATILGANIEDSLFYHWMRDWHGVEFVENTEISRRLRGIPDSVGQRLTVSYFIPGSRFGSKYLFNQQAEGVSNLEKMNRLALAEFKEEPFLYVPNNGTNSNIEEASNCTRVPVVCHGLNRYSNCHNVYCPVALNREQFHLTMLETGFGLSREVIHRATAQEMIYQIVSRTSLRDFGATAPVHAIVPDYTTARRLADLYGSTEVTQIGSLFKESQPLSPAEKQRRYRERQRIAKSQSLTLTSIEPPKEDDETLAMVVTICGERFAKSRTDFSESTLSISDLMEFLRDRSRRVVSVKDEVCLTYRHSIHLTAPTIIAP